MSQSPQTVKRVLGDYKLQTVNSSGTTSANIFLDSGNVTVTGNLTVTGTTTTINTQNSLITDKVITLNQGETGSGVGGNGFSGIEIERGSATNVTLRWNEGDSRWELTNDGTSYGQIATIGGFGGLLAQVEDDTSPVLGGNLDTNGFAITNSVTNSDVTVDPNGTGNLKVESALKIKQVASDPADVSGYTFVYTKSPTAGDENSGVYYRNSTGIDELASKTKAKKFGLIF